MSDQEYKELVLAYYDELVKTGALSSELLSPTPGSIKSKVLKRCSEGFDSKDEKTLQSFVGRKADVGEYYKVVDISSADLYRPLVKVLKKRSVNTNLRNIDLLAWLIDYKPRPFRPDLVPPIKKIPATFDQLVLRPTNDPADPEQQRKTKSKVMVVTGSILIALVLIGIIGIWQYEKRIAVYGCMVWHDDRYQPVGCGDNSSGTKPSPINHQLMDHFKRITRPDTLTLSSIGKVWYAKYNGRVEFYTAPGPHPLDSNRRLLPVSDHILKKYVYHLTN